MIGRLRPVLICLYANDVYIDKDVSPGQADGSVPKLT